MELKEIAVIHTDFPEKFGIPRQSGLVGGLQGTIVFSPEYRNADAIRGLNDFSHLWLVWGFSKAKKDHWSAIASNCSGRILKRSIAFTLVEMPL